MVKRRGRHLSNPQPTTPHQWDDVSALDRISVHRCPTRRVFSGTGLELVAKPATIRYLYPSATAATNIAACVGQDLMTVSRIWNRWFQDGNMER
ncbi:hypothetical protein TNCV_2208221 [Trichonephila clavipes]|uniref:Uncharacterized protein n=1 Tax=Trichonephila clavipes TaxID=2585209 RepID=A0A8X6V5B4_TRICX|nr:hypothetical protein TNCV_2208221 [Trichonephila clavipes]